jgi:excisionase family DNA binding protein
VTTTAANIDPDDPRPLTVREASQLSALGINQTYEAIRRGEIPSIKIGRRILVPRKAFLSLLQDGSPRGTAA